MKTFILEIIPKIQQFSKKLDNISVLTNKHWILLDDLLDKKVIFIFREKDNQLLISENGRIEKATWEYLGENSLLVDRSDGSFLFRHGFIDDSILALKIDGKEEYALFVTEQRFNSEINSFLKVQDFLTNKYENNTETEIKSKLELPTYQKPTKKFEPSAYLNTLQCDLKIIKEKLSHFQSNQKVAILLSFVRNHTINAELVKNSPDIVNIVVSKNLPLEFLEYLFRENQNDIEFIKDLENYVSESITGLSFS